MGGCAFGGVWNSMTLSPADFLIVVIRAGAVNQLRELVCAALAVQGRCAKPQTLSHDPSRQDAVWLEFEFKPLLSLCFFRACVEMSYSGSFRCRAEGCGSLITAMIIVIICKWLPWQLCNNPRFMQATSPPDQCRALQD